RLGLPGRASRRIRPSGRGHYHRPMKLRGWPLRLPAPAHDTLLGLVVAVMQVQGTFAKHADIGARPLTDYGHLAVVLLVVPGVAPIGRRRWPVAVFITAALCSLVYYAIGFSDGPGWIALFVALYSLTAYGDGRRSLTIAASGITVLATGWLI